MALASPFLFVHLIRMKRLATILLALATLGMTKPPVVTSTWVSAPLLEDGFARCKNSAGCGAASFGEVRIYRWNGVDNNNNAVGVYWPIGHNPHVTKAPADWYLGIERPASEWEGVKQSYR